MDRRSGTSPWLRLRTDEQLLGLFRSGSEEAFAVIHDRYRQRLFVYTRQMLGGSGTDAEDVLQDVFLRAYRALRVDERPVSLRAWLYRVSHNRCIDHLRRPVPPAAEIFEMSRTPVHDPLQEAERREDLARLVRDVRRLPDQQRSALLMREMDGMSYADLATALETSVPAVKSLLVRARIGLVEAIDARDADCADIRHDLAASYDRGVRASGRARRHLRECDGCTSFRAQLRGVRHEFAAISPAAAAPGLLAKLLGLGGASAGAGAGGTAVVGGGAAAAVSVGKVAAVVCCAAALTGGAVEVDRFVRPEPSTAPAQAAKRPSPVTAGAVAATAAATSATSAAAAVTTGFHDAPLLARSRRTVTAGAEDLALHPPLPMTPSLAPELENPNGTGGTPAPPAEPTSETPTPTAQPVAGEEDGLTGLTDDATAILVPGDEDAPAASDDESASPQSEGSTTASNGEGTASGGATTSSSPSSQSTGSGASGTGGGTTAQPKSE